MLHYETVSPHLLAVLKKLQAMPELSGFRLVGGTSLSLQLGHRISVGIDLFTDQDFDLYLVQQSISEIFSSFEVRWSGKNGFTSTIEDIKVDLFDWRVSFIKPSIVMEGLTLAHIEDIAAMKLEAITTRKERKDFVDIAFLLRKYDLKTLLSLHKIKYPFISTQFVIESLMAVDYADNTEEPKMLVDLQWSDVKEQIVDTTNSYIREAKKAVEKLQEDRIRNAEELLKKKGRKQ